MKSLILLLSIVSFCFAASDSLPNPILTPGDTLAGADTCICKKGYTRTVRHVSGSTKNKVYEEYGIASRKPAEYEIDHLISLELGGSNDIKNLWPQSYITEPWNARKKDVLENKLNSLVCSKKITLQQAQYEIAHDWIAAYNKYVLGKVIF